MKAQGSTAPTETVDVLAGREVRAIFENAAVGIAFTRDRRFRRCNAQFARMLGYPEGGLVGEPAAVVYPSEAAYEALGDAARPVLGAGEDFQTEVQLRRRDGSIFWCRLYGRAVNPADARNGTVWIAEDVSAQRHSESREAETREELAAVLETAVIGIAVVRDRVVHRCNRRFEELFGQPPGAMVGKSTRLWYASDEDFEGLGATAYPQLASGAIHRREQLFRRADGTLFWGRLCGRAFEKASVHAGSVWILEDVSDRRQREELLRESLDEQEMIFENAAVGIMLVRNRTVQRCNRRLEALYGYPPGELVGHSTAVLHLDLGAFERLGKDAYERLARDETYRCECEVRRRDGSRFWVRGTAHRTREDNLAPPLPGDTSFGVIWIFEDITERRAMQDALLRVNDELESRVTARTSELAEANSRLQAEVFERMQAEARVWEIAHQDVLTGLPNRSLLQDRLQQALAQAERGAYKLALLFIDLDRFKQINDKHGHDVGDIFLRAVADRIRRAVRGVDTVCRFGGDEFVVLLGEVDSADDVLLVGEKIFANLEAPVAVGELLLQGAASIGMSLYPDDAGSADELMRHADAAMYRAKSAGRGTMRFYAKRMNDEAAQFLGTEQSLRGALEAGELELHYQPCVDLAGGNVVAVEALLRWRHPQRGLLVPEDFLEVAEESGLLLPIGDWVLHTACAQAVAWRAAGLGDLPLAVNLSARQFGRESLLKDIAAVLRITGLPSARLELEITEATLMRDRRDSELKLHGLADLGVRVALDDFGSGASCLGGLRGQRLVRLKIDRQLVAGIDASAADAAFVVALVKLAHSLGAAAVAEGVERPAQAEILRAAGCDSATGHLFAPALPAAELAAWQQRRATAAGA